MASYVVAASIFILGSSYLLHFVVHPPGGGTTGLDHLDLRGKAEDALSVLVGSTGTPALWDQDAASIDTLQRLGLVEQGASIRLDPDKFDALARGRLLTTSSGNAGVDYAEAKAALGLSGYEFHVKAYSLVKPGGGDPFGLGGFDAYRVAYVGDASGGSFSADALEEITHLQALNIDFTYSATPGLVPDDAITDDSETLRKELLPNIGALVQQTVLSQGAGTKFDFWRVPKATYDGLTGGTATSTGLALSSDGGTLGYTKNREIRAIVGKADLTGIASAKLTWNEYVDTDRGNASYDCEDYGYVEVSPDNGATWFALTNDRVLRSMDCSSAVPAIVPHGPLMKPRTIADITSACPLCANAPSVLIAYHWVADNDNTIGYGWVVDDVVLTTGVSTTLMTKTFEEPEYDLVIIGSAVDNHAFTPNDVKEALRDYVDKHGGRIFIVGPSTNVAWLDRLFEAGTGGASGDFMTRDASHPLLTLPNKLADTTWVDRGDTWDFTTNAHEDLFHPVLALAPDEHLLSVSRHAAWRGGTSVEGAVILSSYIPHKMTQEEARRFLANGISYGKFHHLHLEVGPEVPQGEAVASAVRTATMNMHRTGTPSYTEMVFILHVWPGASTAATAGPNAVPASPPVEASATPGDGRVTLSWKRPLSNGSALGVQYHIYRGFSPDTTTDTGIRVPYGPWTPTPAPYSYVDTGRTNGVTYYYTILLETTGGILGSGSQAVSATPLAPPDPPANLAASTTQPGKITLTWDAPAQTGGGTIFGYAVYIYDADASDFVLLGEIGSVTTYVHSVADTDARTYKVKALNGALPSGWSGFSGQATGQAIAQIDPPSLDVTTGIGPGNLTLTWAAPDTLGQTLLGYRIYRADAQDGDFTQLVYLNSAANVSFMDVGLGVNVTKWYKVQGVTNYGDGQISAADGAKTMATPDTPTWAAASPITTAPITYDRTLAWNAVTGSDWPVVRYDVYRGGSSDTATMVKIGSASGTLYVDSPGAGTFWYALRAVSAAGESHHSVAKQSA